MVSHSHLLIVPCPDPEHSSNDQEDEEKTSQYTSNTQIPLSGKTVTLVLDGGEVAFARNDCDWQMTILIGHQVFAYSWQMITSVLSPLLAQGCERCCDLLVCW